MQKLIANDIFSFKRNTLNETTWDKATFKVAKFFPLFFTQDIILIVNWKSIKSFTIFDKVILLVCGTTNKPIITQQGTQLHFKKFMTTINVSNLVWNIRKSDVIVIVLHYAKVRKTSESIVLASIKGMCFLTSCFLVGK